MADASTPTPSPTEAAAPPAVPVAPEPATATYDGLPVLPDTPRTLLRTRDPESVLASDDGAIVPEERPSRPAGTVLDTLGQEAVAQLRREGSWQVGFRLIVALVAIVLTFRLASDDALPRLLILLGGGLGVVVVVAVLAQSAAESRRQKAILVALQHVVTIARDRPDALVRMTPQIESLLAALRAPSSVWPWHSDRDLLHGVLERTLPTPVATRTVRDDAAPGDR